MSTDPPVAIFHDLLTPGEMQFMQFSIMSEMKVSTVQDITNPQGGATKVTWERTQASGWRCNPAHGCLGCPASQRASRG